MKNDESWGRMLYPTGVDRVMNTSESRTEQGRSMTSQHCTARKSQGRPRNPVPEILLLVAALWWAGCGPTADQPTASSDGVSTAGAQAPVADAGPAAAQGPTDTEGPSAVDGATPMAVSVEADGTGLDAAAMPAAVRPCVGCHRQAVEEFLAHGMGRALGPVTAANAPPEGQIDNPATGLSYTIRHAKGSSDTVAWLETRYPDGGQRRQRLVGRIGAGIFDTSWAAEDVDALEGTPTGRYYFAPVETLPGHGNELSPFDLAEPAAGPDFALTEACLTCHTNTRLADLPGVDAPDGAAAPYPAHAFGTGAFEHLEPFTCDTCHGDPSLHLDLMMGTEEGILGDTGISHLAEETAGFQRDVCARCHLQGDSRLDLVAGRPDPRSPLAAQIPVLVPQRQDEDFRFVGQLERLALSPCFEGSPDMTCTTCHSPHQGVAQQGIASFDRACQACHGDAGSMCSRAPDLTVEAVLGEPARTADGCVDCHVRRSQPFDLPHVRSADHYVRRNIPRPQNDIPHRQVADADGPLEFFDDGRLSEVLGTAAGQRWQSGIEAVSLLTLGKVDEAAERFDAFPAPGTDAARTPSAPAPLVPVETWADFHQSRGLALMAKGRFEDAEQAFGDALELDPNAAGALMNRARLRLDLGNPVGMMEDTERVIDGYPGAPEPWLLRADLAERMGRAGLAQDAFEEAGRRGHNDASVWFKLGLLLRQSGREAEARDALDRARTLSPSLELPGAGRVSDH